jgi:peroxiredoxin
MLNIGDNAPDYVLVSDEGKLVKLYDFRGQQVLILFYHNADTPGCKTQA